MGDPELRSDEKILLRTPGVFVKSIAFEGYLTNKRIILIDRVKNLLPQKEIQPFTIKDIEPGEKRDTRSDHNVVHPGKKR